MKILYSNNNKFSDYVKDLHTNYSPTALLSPLGCMYQRSYTGISYIDCSFIILNGDEPLVLFIAAVDSKLKELSGFGFASLLVEVPKAKIFDKGIKKVLKKELDRLIEKYSLQKILYTDYLSNNHLSSISILLLDMGAKISNNYSQIINLNDEILDISKNVRKSYKSLLNWGRKNLIIKIVDQTNFKPDDMDSFRALHIEVAGRETRNKQSWDIQSKQILNNEAFMIMGYLDGNLITSALFLYNKFTCYYGVSASLRSFFDKPISHIIIFEGILHAKKINCSQFELGTQYYNGVHGDYIDKKNYDICKFKRGFGGITQVRLDLSLEINNE